MPSTTAPQGFAARGKVVCSCLNVTDTEINKALGDMDGLPADVLTGLQSKLKCGTNCGSCVSEIATIIKSTVAQAATA
jgi:assimilatory nitrate reductase catalytic subunit